MVRVFAILGIPVLFVVSVTFLLRLSASNGSDQRVQATATVIPVTTFSDPNVGVTVQYPVDLSAEPEHTAAGQVMGLDLTFNLGGKAADGEKPEIGQLGIDRYENPQNLPLAEWVRGALRGSKGVVVLGSCSFQVDAVECLEIKDQQSWAGQFHPSSRR